MNFNVSIKKDGKILSSDCELADSAFSRMRGLLGRTKLADMQSLWIVPCNSVHTFFMKFTIDVVFLDKEKKVVAINHSMPPYRHSWIYWRARSVLELPAGRCRAVNLNVGDYLAFQPGGVNVG
jgi:uncharacterized membrane protein (UPF0127 family)